jgi:hypothetical protein
LSRSKQGDGLQWDRINSEAVRIKGALKKARHHLCIV